MAHQPIEQLALFALYEEVSAWAWHRVSGWDNFAKHTIGEQLVRAVDSINANLVEGDGRYSKNDALRFFIIARGSARESRLWIKRAIARQLVEESEGTSNVEKLERATKLLNLLIDYRRKEKDADLVKEDTAKYEDGFSQTIREEA